MGAFTGAGTRPFPLVAVILAALSFLLVLPAPGQESPLVSDAVSPAADRLVTSFSELPLSFEANGGQADESVRFISRAGGFATMLTDDGVLLASASGNETAVVGVRFVGASDAMSLSPGEALAGNVNYFIGNDPDAWRTDIPTYSSVTYENVYPGVDAVLYGNPGQLEYDFIVAPGTSPDVIGLRFEGAESLRLDGDGNLVATIGGGEFVQSSPVVYQEFDGAREPVSGAYVIDGDEVGFEIGAYDETLPLVIDPILIFGSYLGGGMRDIGKGIATDDDGNVYVVGQTTSTDFPTTPGVVEPDRPGATTQPDLFVTKISADGSEILYSSYLGGSGSDLGRDIEVDSEGQAYFVGSGAGDYPTTPGAFSTSGGAVVTKLSDDGSEILYSTKLGSNTNAYGVEINDDGDAYVAGFSLGNGFDATAGAFSEQVTGNGDAIVAVVNEDGTGLVWGTFIGGAGRDRGQDIAIDSEGYVYLTGWTPSADFPTMNAFQDTQASGQEDAFVTKFMPDGSSLVYSTYLGGTGGGESDRGYGIDVDDDGNAYVTGQTNSGDFPVSANRLQDYGGNTDAFVAKFGPNGNMVYSTFLGGSNVDIGAGIEVDADGNAHVAGNTVSGNFPTEDPFQSSHGGGSDVFVAKLNGSGTGLIYSTFLGSDDSDRIDSGGDGAMALDDLGNAYVTGTTESTDFPTRDPFQPNNAGDFDAFVVKLLGEGFLWGDVDCTAGLAATDALNVLRHVAGLGVNQNEPCPDIGDQATVLPAGAVQVTWGDVDCSGGVNAVDALAQLRFIAGLSVNQNEPCLDVGTVIQIVD